MMVVTVVVVMAVKRSCTREREQHMHLFDRWSAAWLWKLRQAAETPRLTD